jgi:hypothetical protein
MMQHTKQQGYVMVLALMVIAVMVALVTMMAQKSSVHMHYMKTMINREKAKNLAWSGVQIAMSQLANAEKNKDKKETVALETREGQSKQQQQQKKDPFEEQRRFLSNMLPVLTTWQNFKLTQQQDGVRGQISICIGCEDGKIDLNQFFDFAHKKFSNEGAGKDDAKKLFQELFTKLKDVQGGESLFGAFEKFLKDRQNKLHDPSELCAIKEFDSFKDKLFFVPESVQQRSGGRERRAVYLQDIFTVWSSKKELNPWLLSHSLQVLCGLQPVRDQKLTSKELEGKLKELKQELAFPKDWDRFLAPIFGKKFEQLPQELRKVMSTKFEPHVFSVLSYGTAENVTQKLLVIVERTKAPVADSTGQNVVVFQAKRCYWL